MELIFLLEREKPMYLWVHNGTGKSTLGLAIMGNPRYTVKKGEIWFDGKNITNRSC